MTNTTIQLPSTITLEANAGTNYVTWAEGKKQVRSLLKAHGFMPVGLFRGRKEGKNEFCIQASKDSAMYTVTVDRKPGATFLFTAQLKHDVLTPVEPQK